MTHEGRGRTSGHCCEPVDRRASIERGATYSEKGHVSFLASVSRAEPRVLGYGNFGFGGLLCRWVGLLEGDLGLAEAGGVSGVSTDSAREDCKRVE